MNNHNIEKLLKQAKNRAKSLGKTCNRSLDKIIFYLKNIHMLQKIDNLAKNLKFSLPKVKNSFYIGLVLTLVLASIFLTSQVDNSTKQSASLTNLTIETGLPEISNQTQTQTKESDFSIASQQEPDDSTFYTATGSAIIPPKAQFSASAPKTRTEIETYTVQPGDTVSTIANKFGLYWSTILWENDLSSWSVIKPGQELKILPVDGITHKVKKGENLSYIAKKYNSSTEQISKFNDVDDEISPGQTLIVPDGTPPPKPKPKPAPAPAPTYAQTQTNNHNYSNYWDWWGTTNCHKFIARQCTSWAAYKWALEQKQCVPSWGNAESWFYNAKSAGYDVGYQAKPGAIMYLTCTSWLCQRYGHVAYVESANGSHVTISEMNGLKSEAYSSRTLLNKTSVWQSGWKILGYIYPLQ